MARLAPSILSADFGNLASDIAVVAPEADWLHVDVMDGHFVPNLTIGPPVVEAVRRHTDLYLDCHLMISEPWRYLEAFTTAGANHCSVHVEVGRTAELIDQMRDLGLDVGLVLNPETSFDEVDPWLERVDLLLVMSVHPGFGGQRFMSEVIPKVAAASRARTERQLDLVIEVDGGLDVHTVGSVVEAGADMLVAGSAIFGADDPCLAAGELRAAALRAESGRG